MDDPRTWKLGNSGPPPSIGWWPVSPDAYLLRWWDGEDWSWPCISTDTIAQVIYYSSKMDTDVLAGHKVLWFPRPADWPERSMT
jgi:hypothetical protein